MEGEMVLAITEHYVKEYVKANQSNNISRLEVVNSVIHVLSPTLYRELKRVHGET